MIKITVIFNAGGPQKEVYWHDDLLNFPKVITFQGNCYEWITCNLNSDGISATLLLGSASIHAYPFPVPSFERMFEEKTELIKINECTCGARYDREFPNNHMFMCKLWSPPW